jgi:ABC-2 type transport system ATP-binding protein
MIEVRDLVRNSGARRVLDRVSLRVEPGEVVGFLGPNGAGKTTTLRVLAGVLPPHGGRVLIAGTDSPLEDRAARGRRTGPCRRRTRRA